MHALPLDLVPGVLDALRWRVGDLAACCRVSRIWNGIATARLYERLWLRDQTRVIRVFQTLSDHPRLARLVRILGRSLADPKELRVFPFGLPAEQLERLEAQIVTALHAATNLRVLCWTRDGSLNDRLVRTMFDHLHRLHKLEITGNSKLWTPALLCEKMPRSVRELHIVLPDRNVARHLVALAARVHTLEALSLFCMVRRTPMQSTSEITDALLAEVAAHSHLQRLTLVGCKAVHGPGVVQLARSGTLHSLALEGMGLAPDALPALLPYVRQVRALTLTYPKRAEEAPSFFQHLGAMTAACDQLEALTLYACGGSAPVQGAHLPPTTTPHPVRSAPSTAVVPLDTAPEVNRSLDWAFVRQLLFSRASRTLRKLWVYEVAVSMHQLQLLALSRLSDHLEDLVVHLYERDLACLQLYLAKFSRLRSVHIMSHAASDAEFTFEELVQIARHCSGNLCQIGFRNRVWNVKVHGQERELERYDMAAGVYPEKLLVVRAV